MSKIWKTFYDIDETAALRIRSTLQEHQEVFREFDRTKLDRVLRFVKTRGLTEDRLMDYEVEADLRIVHGDFNARNLLVNKEGQLVVIDFSSRGLNHIARDIAKLERDIVFRVCDNLLKDCYDWSRIEYWRDFSKLNQKGMVFSFEVSDSGLGPTAYIGFILELRRILKTESPELTEEEYLMGLAHFSLLALIHPEVSIQKKVFAVEYVGNILEALA